MVERIRYGPSTVLDQVETRNRVWNPETLDFEVLTNETSALPDSATVTKVASTIVSTTLAAANTARRGLSIFNDSTANLYVKHGTTAALDDFTVKIAAGGYFELPYLCYTGRIDGIWSAQNGNAFVTELT